MKLADGWHRIPGDGQDGDKYRRASGWDHASLTTRFHHWAYVKNGKIVGINGFGGYDKIPDEGPMQGMQYYLTACEKKWGCSIESLFEPKEAGWSKVIGLSLLGLLSAGAVGRFRKRATKSSAQTKSAAQPVEAKR